MADIKTYGDRFPIEETLCNSCKYRLSRTFIPINLESFNIDEDTLKEIGVDEDGDIAIEQHTCLIIGEDLDYIVLTCNRYEPIGNTDLIRHNIF